jgi:hypothetical protein
MFARGKHDGGDYALKFYVMRASFESERSLYQTKALGSLLPQVCHATLAHAQARTSGIHMHGENVVALR